MLPGRFVLTQLVYVVKSAIEGTVNVGDDANNSRHLADGNVSKTKGFYSRSINHTAIKKGDAIKLYLGSGSGELRMIAVGFLVKSD